MAEASRSIETIHDPIHDPRCAVAGGGGRWLAWEDETEKARYCVAGSSDWTCTRLVLVVGTVPASYYENGAGD